MVNNNDGTTKLATGNTKLATGTTKLAIGTKEIIPRDIERAWEELKISNDFLFNKIMQNPQICKRLLEIVLEVKIERIEYPETEKNIRMMKDGKGVRLDVYVADEVHTVYNVEMQATNTKELPKRSRYYQGIIDMDIIAKGQLYNALHTSYVIFICTFDLFGKGFYKYTFENRCIEDYDIALGDGTKKIFLNATGFMGEANEDIRAFLEYVSGQESDNEFVQMLKQEANTVKNNQNWRREFMMQQMRDQLKIEEGRERGIERGREEGDFLRLISQIIKKIQKSKTLDVIADELECEPDEIQKFYDVVKNWETDCSAEEVLEKVKGNKEA
ncbi:MAG: Rpn family recombination-promoting nuclease/putative transposase [Eubacteriales bacterium]